MIGLLGEIMPEPAICASGEYDNNPVTSANTSGGNMSS
jgi:hypothetical protein